MDDAQRSVERVKHSIQEFEKTKKAYEAKYGEGSYEKNLKKYNQVPLPKQNALVVFLHQIYLYF
jgi:hypothetical protein